MQNYRNTVFLLDGGRAVGASVLVNLGGTATPATIYSDDGVTAAANPLTTTNLGEFTFWADPGLYDFVISHSTFPTRYWNDVQLYDMAGTGAPWFDVRDTAYGAKGDGVTDDASAIQAACDAAFAASPDACVYIPPGDYYVGSTINYKVNIRGEGQHTQLISHINDGTAVLQNLTTDRCSVQDIFIMPEDAGVTGNWIGVKINCNRTYMSNVRVRRALVGFDVSGFIYDFVNLWATYCTTGFRADEFNANRVHINTEVCTTGVIIEDGAGWELTGVCEDNGTGLVVDDSTAARIQMYFENNTVSDILVGQTGLCKNIKVAATIASTNATCVFDMVDGLDLSESRVAALTHVYITDNAVNVQNLPYPTPSIGDYADMTRSYPRNIKTAAGFGTLENFFLNPYFRDVYSGYVSVVPARATLSIDTVNMIRGGGLRFTATGVLGSALAQITLNPDIALELAGKVAYVGGWVYIPADDVVFPDPGGVSGALPDITLSYSNGGAFTDPGTVSQTWTNGGWSFFARQVEIPADTTALRVDLYQSRSGAYTVPIGTVTTFSGIFLVEAPADLQDLMMGRWVMHPLSEMATASAEYNVIDYGATADGATDDSAAIQAAIDAAEAAGGGTVLLPAGDYAIEAGLVIDSDGVTLQGVGMGGEAIGGSVIEAHGAGPFTMLTIGSAAGVTVSSGIRDLKLYGTSDYSANCGLKLLNAHGCYAEDCRINLNRADDDARPAVWLDTSTGYATQNNKFIACEIFSPTLKTGGVASYGYGVLISNSGYTDGDPEYNIRNHFTNCRFYNGATDIGGKTFQTEDTAVGRNTVTACSFQCVGDQGINLSGSFGGDVLTGCQIQGDGSEVLTFAAGANDCVFIGNISGGTWSDANSDVEKAVVLDAGADNGLVARGFVCQPRSAAPAAPMEGEIYYDSDTNKLNVWTGAAWETITSA